MSLTLTTSSVYAAPEPRQINAQTAEDNWFMRLVMKDIREGDPPTIVIGGKKRGGKSFLSMAIAEAIVQRCRKMKYAYRDKGLSTESKYDLREAQFDVSQQLLYSLRTIPDLLQDPPPNGSGLPYGSPIISDESSVTANALGFNSPVVKRVTEIHDTMGFRLIPWLFNVPGSVARLAYQLRETAGYFIQMKTRGVAKVYETNPVVTGRVWLHKIGWLGWQNPFTGKVVYRISAPSDETRSAYNALKTFWGRRQLDKTRQRLRDLAEQGFLGPYDDISDYADTPINTTMMTPKQRKRKIPNCDTEEDEDADS
jgi:hypothetical protein